MWQGQFRCATLVQQSCVWQLIELAMTKHFVEVMPGGVETSVTALQAECPHCFGYIQGMDIIMNQL